MSSRVIRATTADTYGNRRTWRMTGDPAFCDAAMVERRALARHVSTFGVISAAFIGAIWEAGTDA